MGVMQELAQHTVYQTALTMLLMEKYPKVRFNHLKVAYFGDRLAVFVVKDNQSTVLYDKTQNFPSAKLMASLTLLGSP